jgi:glutaredoxin 3
MYCTSFCRFCTMAERLLENKGVGDIEKIFVDPQQELRTEMIERTGRRTVPQIFIGETHVGGYDDLAELERRGELDRLLAGSG